MSRALNEQACLIKYTAHTNDRVSFLDEVLSIAQVWSFKLITNAKFVKLSFPVGGGGKVIRVYYLVII